MKAGKRVRVLSLAVFSALYLSACGSGDPQTLVSSAKQYIDKNDNKAAVIQLKNALVKNPDLGEARFLLGKTLLESGDPVGAEVELRKAEKLNYDPNSVTPVLAKALIETGQPGKVTAELAAKKLSDAASLASLETSLGIAYAMQGDLAKAKQYIDEAIKTKPDYDPALVAQAQLMLNGSDINGALAQLDDALKKNPNNFQALKLKGDILNYQGKEDEAVALYEEAIRNKPDNGAAYTALINTELRQNQLDKAGKHLEAMKKALPNLVQTAMVEAVYDYQTKEYQKARELVEKIQRSVADDPRVLLLAGAIQMHLGAFLQAEDSLKRASSLIPASPTPHRYLAELYLRNGMSGKALDQLQPLLKSDSKDPALLSLAGTAYLQAGNAQQANDYFNRAAQLAPNNETIRVRSALSQLALGHKQSGFAALEEIAGSEKDTMADMALISATVQAKEYDKAMQAIDNLEKKEPDSPVPNGLRGMTMMNKGDLAGARSYYQKALESKPDYLSAIAGLASIDLKENKVADAKGRFESLLKIQPNDLTALLALASLESRTGGSASRVEELLSRAVKGNPKEPKARLAQIEYFMSTKNTAKAVSAGKEAVSALPDRPELMDALARAQMANGQTADALSTYENVVKALPNSPQAYLVMAELQYNAKQPDAAIETLKKTLSIKSDFLPAQQALIRVYLGVKNYAAAQQITAVLQKQHPESALGKALEGDVYAVQNQWAQAAESFHAALGKQAISQVAVKYHNALVKAGKGKDAEAFGKQWIAAHPADEAFQLYAADYAMRTRNFTSAASQYKALLRTQSKNPIVLNNLAWVLGQMNDSQALGYAEQANKLAPQQPQIMDTLAMLVAKSGDSARAITLLQDALKLNPKANDIKLDLAKVYLQARRQDEATKLLKELDGLGSGFASSEEVKKLLATSGSR